MEQRGLILYKRSLAENDKRLLGEENNNIKEKIKGVKTVFTGISDSCSVSSLGALLTHFLSVFSFLWTPLENSFSLGSFS